MSGIWGIVEKYKVNVDNFLLEKMSYSISRHGNDGTKIIRYKNIGLGHKQLWTTQESLSENQPLISFDKAFIITADVRVDNRKELIKCLYPELSKEIVITDVDLLLSAYQKWFEECPKYIIGDFSFAIWDKQKQQLFCARDRLGIKPFYYYNCVDRFTFSSEVSALINLPGYVRRPCKASMLSFLEHDGEIEFGHTMYKDILSLPPAYCLVYKNEEVIINRYWHPENIKIQKNITLEEASNSFLAIFKEAVHCRMRSAFPIGFELSGGLDSSSVVSIANMTKSLEQNFTLSMLFENFKCDESEYINAVLAKSNMQYITFDVSRIDYKKTYFIDWIYEGNTDWPNRFLPALSMTLRKEAQKKNIRVILNGLGGDELVRGNFEMLTDYVKDGKWFKLFDEIKSYRYKKMLIKEYIILPFLNEKKRKTIKKALEFLKLRKKNIRKEEGDRKQYIVDPLECESLAQHVDIEYILGQYHASWADNNPTNISGRYNIEFRSPFYDSRLVEFLLSLPNEFKLSKGRSKIILREAMKGILPEKIRTRKDKAEYSEILFEHVNAINLDKFWQKMYIVDLNFITKNEIIELVSTFKVMGLKTSSAVTVKLWHLINLEKWYRVNFIDKVEK